MQRTQINHNSVITCNRSYIVTCFAGGNFSLGICAQGWTYCQICRSAACCARCRRMCQSGSLLGIQATRDNPAEHPATQRTRLKSSRPASSGVSSSTRQSRAILRLLEVCTRFSFISCVLAPNCEAKGTMIELEAYSLLDLKHLNEFSCMDIPADRACDSAVAFV